ncbi:hypothetical protein QBC47DRAFT_409613 [Echria macrotheca]|uniref:Fungal N-terminal domain-containing protein n=1 Tax=Echria macrotheca TaxID=438768 RepID=A0AAJ0BI87_9PEZI|nr:hypothetical protein QBC47DRAFT_409613 [Echria macrotheca]
MDPLSIASSCLAVAGAAVKVGTDITRFIIRCREAKDDLTALSRQTADLNLVLGLLKDDLAPEEGPCRVPPSFQPQLGPIIDNCNSILAEVDALLSKYQPRSGMRWALFGKDKVLGLEKQLDAHVKALNITVTCIQMSVTHDIKGDTTKIRQDVEDIGENAALIPEVRDDIAELRALFLRWQSQQTSGLTPREWVLNRYLDSVTTYCESIVGEPFPHDVETISYQGEPKDSRRSGERTELVEAASDRRIMGTRVTEPRVGGGVSSKCQDESEILPKHPEPTKTEKSPSHPPQLIQSNKETEAVSLGKSADIVKLSPFLPDLHDVEVFPLDIDDTVIREFVVKDPNADIYTTHVIEGASSMNEQRWKSMIQKNDFFLCVVAITGFLIPKSIQGMPTFYTFIIDMLHALAKMATGLGYEAQDHGSPGTIISLNTPGGKKFYQILQPTSLQRHLHPPWFTPCLLCPDGEIRLFRFQNLDLGTIKTYQAKGHPEHKAISMLYHKYSDRRLGVYEISSLCLTRPELEDWDQICKATDCEGGTLLCDQAYGQLTAKCPPSFLGAFAFEHLPQPSIPEAIRTAQISDKKIWAVTTLTLAPATTMAHSSCGIVYPPDRKALTPQWFDLWSSGISEERVDRIRRNFGGPRAFYVPKETVLFIDRSEVLMAIATDMEGALFRVAFMFPAVVFYRMEPAEIDWVISTVDLSKGQPRRTKTPAVYDGAALVSFLEEVLRKKQKEEAADGVSGEDRGNSKGLKHREGLLEKTMRRLSWLRLGRK